jgi:folate-binding protein YgfZ
VSGEAAAALRDTAAAVVLDSAGVVALTGPDARTFLQSLASQDLDGLEIGEARHSLLLTPQGKLTADFRVLRAGSDELWLRCEPGVAGELAGALTRFRIRVKVDIADCSADFGAVAVRGPQSHAVPIGVPEGVHDVVVDWPGNPGRELLGPRAAVQDLDLGELPRATSADLEALRIESGVPRQPFDIDERTIAQEAFLDETAVSFTKGCFLGQELVCRIDARGHVNRLLRRLDGAAPLVAGAPVVDAAGKQVGVVTSAAVSPRAGPIALAMLRREVEVGASVRAGETAATVRELDVAAR